MNKNYFESHQTMSNTVKFAEIIAVVVILLIFSAIFLKYYNTSGPYENPRFVNIDYNALESEANALQVERTTGKVASNIFVLNYHVVTKNEPQDTYEISYEQFKENMFTLKKLGYNTVTLTDFYLFLRGEKQLPDKSFVLTFDDGAKAAYYNADPILKVLNYTAVMFVITGGSLSDINKAYYLNESELIEMQNTKRWELESHTHMSHYRLQINPNGQTGPALTNKLWLANESRLETNQEYVNRITNDLQTADYLLETKLNKTITSFALPFGDFGERGSNYPQAHDILYNLTNQQYKLIFYQFKPTKDRDYRANYNDEKLNSYLVVRLSVDNLRTPEKLLKEIEASRPAALPYYENYKNDDKWARLSGEASFISNAIILQNGTQNGIESMMAYLDGSYLWRNYKYSIQVKNHGASTVILLARFKSSVNYMGCIYGKGMVRILQVKNNVAAIINEQKIENQTEVPINTPLAVKVQGQDITCLQNNLPIITSNVPDMPQYGGVGVRAEGFEKFDKTFKFANIQVE